MDIYNKCYVHFLLKKLVIACCFVASFFLEDNFPLGCGGIVLVTFNGTSTNSSSLTSVDSLS